MKLYNPDGTSREYKSSKTKVEEMELGCHIKTPQGTEHHFETYMVAGYDEDVGSLEIFGNLDLISLFKLISVYQDMFKETYEQLSEEEKQYFLFLLSQDLEEDEE